MPQYSGFTFKFVPSIHYSSTSSILAIDSEHRHRDAKKYLISVDGAGREGHD